MSEQTPEQSSYRQFGLGCLVLVGVLLVASTVIGFFVRTWLAAHTDEIRTEFETAYTQWQEEDRIPEEHRELFATLHEQAVRPEAGMLAVTVVLAAMSAAIEDNQVTEKEVTMLTDLRDLLANDPSPGWGGFIDFQQKYPVLQEALQEYEPVSAETGA